MKQTIQTTVVQIENEQGEHPAVTLRCCAGEALPTKATVSAKAIFCEQEVLVAGSDRLKIFGKGKPTVGVGDTGGNLRTLGDHIIPKGTSGELVPRESLGISEGDPSYVKL